MITLYGNYNIVFTIADSSLLLSSKIEHVVTVAKIQLQIIVTKRSILDARCGSDLPLIKVFGKVIFHMAQATVIQFNLIAIYGSSCLYGNCKIIFYLRMNGVQSCSWYFQTFWWLSKFFYNHNWNKEWILGN